MTYSGTTQLYDPKTVTSQRIDALGSAQVEQRERVAGYRFGAVLAGAIYSSPVLQTTYDLFWAYTLGAATGSAAAGQTGSLATFTSGTTANNWVSGKSQSLGQFRFATQNSWRALIRTSTVAPGVAASSTTFFGPIAVNAGAATASGYVGAANAINSGLSNISSYYQNKPLNDMLMNYYRTSGPTQTLI